MAAEIAGGVYAYATKDSLVNTLTDKAKDYLKNKYNDSGNSDDSGWNFVMVLVSYPVDMSMR